MKKKESRHGKHREDKVQFGGMVTPEFKALAQMTASVSKCSMMDLMINGINNIATGAGILKNGEITPKYRESIAALADIIRTTLSEKRNSNLNK